MRRTSAEASERKGGGVITRRTTLACFAAGLSLSPAQAEMLQFESGNQTIAWPKLPAVADWHQDQAASLANTANVLIPDGVSFADADAVILAKGFPRAGKSIDQVMANDRGAADPAIHVAKLTDIADKDTRPFALLSFIGLGAWQARAYAEEGNYFLVFTFRAKSKAAYDKRFPVFSQMIQDYAEMIPW
ncbi:MAG TPA: hypothetical protein VHV26_13735 [Rhizomicrobium sp.]|nr:hypothetical protein [Rhizomicrobium sp.]